jgi:RNA polymerase sigma-70 factor (ECF subfamily)
MSDQLAGKVGPALSADQAERLSTLFDAHADRLYRLARRLARHADEALDLVQETFLRAARSPGSVPSGAGDEEAWLVRVLVNIQRDQWRRQSVRQRHAAAFERAPNETRSPADDAIIRTAVWQAVNDLPPRRRAIVVMHEIEGLSTRDISVLLGITAITVRWHLSRGRRELAQRLEPLSGDNDEPQLEGPLARRRPRPSRSPAS